MQGEKVLSQHVGNGDNNNNNTLIPAITDYIQVQEL